MSPRTVIGSRFAGKVWESGFEALRQFDADQNGVVEADELNDLYVWRDADSSGTFEAVVRTGRKDEIIACRERFAGFDLRTAAVRKSGYAREGLLAPFAVFRSHRSRIHLLEFAIRGSFTDRFRGYLSYAGTQQVDPDHRFSGEWRWEMNAQRGRLLLAASGREIRGIVQYEGRHADIINLPLEGVVTDGQAEWQSVSPLGLTRSVVRLSQEFGQTVLHGQAWSTRNGKLQKGSWKAYYAKPLSKRESWLLAIVMVVLVGVSVWQGVKLRAIQHELKKTYYAERVRTAQLILEGEMLSAAYFTATDAQTKRLARTYLERLVK
ncbi:hypothetical protein C2W62_26400 [Candidatus Entotheonella serta]|nr:hypothetical protein C2W62_26400 [Candidatus Entotheonella serta]